jgi:hypothetical protein
MLYQTATIYTTEQMLAVVADAADKCFINEIHIDYQLYPVH